jgi:hypothetical protein
MSSSVLSYKVFLYNIFGGIRTGSRGRILSSTKPYQAGTAQAHVLSQAGTLVGIVRQLCLCMWKRSCYNPMLSVFPIVLMCMRLLKKDRYYCRLIIKHILTVICLCVYYSSYVQHGPDQLYSYIYRASTWKDCRRGTLDLIPGLNT